MGSYHYSILTTIERYGSEILEKVDHNQYAWKTKKGEIRYSVSYFTRQKILFRDKHACRVCSRKLPDNKLVVHHVKYEEQPTTKDLITLCNACHGKVHSGRLKLNV